MQSTIRKNYLYNVSLQIFSLLMPLITTPYVARALQPAGVGAYSYANSIAVFFSLLAGMGISSYGLRELSRCRDDRERSVQLFRELSWLRLLTTAAALVLYLVFVLLFGSSWRVYLACGLVILSAGMDCNWYFQAKENFRILMVRNFFIKAATMVCILVFVREPGDLVLYILFQGGGTLLSNGLLWLRLTRRMPRIPWRRLHIRRHFRGTLPYFIPSVATTVYTVLDRTMIGLITRDMEQNGYYEQASRIIHILMAVITSLNVVVGVRTSYLFARNRKREIRQHLYDTFRFTYLLSFPMAAGLLACAPHFVPWFFGVGYDAVTPLLQALTPLLFIIGTSNVLGTLYLTPCGQRGRSNRAIVTGAVLNFLLNLILIPFLQAYGAVIASVAAETVITLLYLYYCRRFVRLAQILGLALRYFLLSAGMFVPVWLVGRACAPGLPGILLQIGTGMAVYAAGLILLRDPAWQEVCRFLRRRKKRGEVPPPEEEEP